MSSAVNIICKGCGGAIVPPGPMISYEGHEGKYHVSCATSAACDWARADEREACARIADAEKEHAVSELYSIPVAAAAESIARQIRSRNK